MDTSDHHAIMRYLDDMNAMLDSRTQTRQYFTGIVLALRAFEDKWPQARQDINDIWDAVILNVPRRTSAESCIRPYDNPIGSDYQLENHDR